MSYVQRIKEARINAGMTQEQLAQAVGVAKSTITSYEKGNREISAGMIQRIAQATGSSVEFIFQDEERERQPADNSGLSDVEIAFFNEFRKIPDSHKGLAASLCTALVRELVKHQKVEIAAEVSVPAGLSH